MEKLIEECIDLYQQRWQHRPEIVVAAPGRVNLIGEHTDYNDGLVLPVAINRKVIVSAGKRDDRKISIASVNFHSSVEIELGSASFEESFLWQNYPLGVVHVLQDHGHHLGGMNLSVNGGIPIGAGLSSSAALTVACMIACSLIFDLRLPPKKIIEYARQVETEFIHVHCGIMDQFISVMGKKSHALFLDCRTEQFSFVQLPVAARLIVFDTGVKRDLVHSEYNRRREECAEATRRLAMGKSSMTSLRDVTSPMLEECRQYIGPLLAQRARHVVSENERVTLSVGALRNNDLRAFGRLLSASHASLRNDFEVSSKELDTIVDIATADEHVHGARMTGAGFGGCAICLVSEYPHDRFIQRLRNEYFKRLGVELSAYEVTAEDGATIIRPEFPYSQRRFAEESST